MFFFFSYWLCKVAVISGLCNFKPTAILKIINKYNCYNYWLTSSQVEHRHFNIKDKKEETYSHQSAVTWLNGGFRGFLTSLSLVRTGCSLSELLTTYCSTGSSLPLLWLFPTIADLPTPDQEESELLLPPNGRCLSLTSSPYLIPDRRTTSPMQQSTLISAAIVTRVSSWWTAEQFDFKCTESVTACVASVCFAWPLEGGSRYWLSYST